MWDLKHLYYSRFPIYQQSLLLIVLSKKYYRIFLKDASFHLLHLILIYNLNRNPRIDAYAKELSIKTGLEVRYLSYQLHEFYKNGKMFCNPPVEDFLALIDGADYVITDSFHATAFSLNFNKEFVIVYPGKYSTRLQSILEILGLTNRVAKNERDLSIVESKIDYNRVNEILAAERKRSLLWLSNALSGVKNEDSM